MPTYEYRCPDGHAFEVFQRMSDDPVSHCPECGKAAERQISGGAGFLFKGDGFYITDSRSEEYKKKASAEADGGSSSDSEEKGTKESSGGSAPKTAAGDSASASSGGSSSSSSSSSSSDA